MGIVKENPGCGQAVQVWRLGLRMPAHATYPIVQIVHRDEENVGFCYTHHWGQACPQAEEHEDSSRANHAKTDRKCGVFDNHWEARRVRQPLVFLVEIRIGQDIPFAQIK